LVILAVSCSKKPSYTSNANNTEFNTKYKGQFRTIPLQNLNYLDDKRQFVQNGYQYYSQKITNLEEKYQENAAYFDFLSKNDFSRMKNITVETLPKENYEYIKLARNGLSSELNKLNQVEIQYIMFIKQASIAKLTTEYHGDPIMHPFIYQEPRRADRHIVMGDEYPRWDSVCGSGLC
jgi:hypothetical protein